ncbi:MAG: DUF6252 family protein [Saprospiraceae bacterium]
MKQFPIFMMILLSTAFLLTSCSKDNDGPGVDAGNGKVTATVDGKSWASKDEASGAVYADAQGTHTITAYHEDGSFIGLTIFGNISSGTTIQVDNSGLFQAQYKPDFMGSELYTALAALGSGSITFTTFNDSKVKGTFQFTAVKFDQTGAQTELEVKNGSFDIDL